MRTAIFMIILLVLSSLYISGQRHHIQSFVSELQYHADKFEAALSGRGRHSAPRRTWETGDGSRTHTTGHGYYQRRADRGR